MDPKQTNNLDPKLKEVFDRVMNTKVVPKTPIADSNPTTSSQTPISQTPPLQDVSNPQPMFTQTAPIATNQLDTSLPTTNSPLPVPEIIQPTVESPKLPGDSMSATAQLSPSLQEMPTLSTHASGFSAVTVPSVNPTAIKEPKKSSPLFTLFVIVLMIIFFIVYSFFWMKFFNVTLPF